MPASFANRLKTLFDLYKQQFDDYLQFKDADISQSLLLNNEGEALIKLLIKDRDILKQKSLHWPAFELFLSKYGNSSIFQNNNTHSSTAYFYNMDQIYHFCVSFPLVALCCLNLIILHPGCLQQLFDREYGKKVYGKSWLWTNRNEYNIRYSESQTATLITTILINHSFVRLYCLIDTEFTKKLSKHLNEESVNTIILRTSLDWRSAFFSNVEENNIKIENELKVPWKYKSH